MSVHLLVKSKKIKSMHILSNHSHKYVLYSKVCMTMHIRYNKSSSNKIKLMLQNVLKLLKCTIAKK